MLATRVQVQARRQVPAPFRRAVDPRGGLGQRVHTVLVYLNDDFEGGHTTFLEQQPDAFRIDLPSSEHPGGTVIDKRVRASVQPRTGSVLVFNRHRRHCRASAEWTYAHRIQWGTFALLNNEQGLQNRAIT